MKIPNMPFVVEFLVNVRWCFIGALYAALPWPENALYGTGLLLLTDPPLWRYLCRLACRFLGSRRARARRGY